MVLKYHISTSAFTENFIVKIYESANVTPGAEVYTTTLVEKNGGGVPTPGAGHQVTETVTANGLDRVVHTVLLVGAVSNLVYHNYDAEPTTDTISVFDPIQFKIGDGGPDTPTANQPNATTPQLIGLAATDFIITRNNYGILFPGLHFDFNSLDGSWALLGGDQFNDQEEFTIERKPLITTVVNDSVVGKYFAGFVDVSADVDYDATHLRKLIRFTGTANYSFQFNPPIGYGYWFQNFGSGTGTVKFNNGTLLWSGSPKSQITIPKYSAAMFTWDGTNWNVALITDASFINTLTSQPGQIIAAGVFNVGDVLAGDPDFTIVHNKAITGDYMVLWTIKSNTSATKIYDNDVMGSWYHDVADKPNRFHVCLQERFAAAQDLSIAWTIIKL